MQLIVKFLLCLLICCRFKGRFESQEAGRLRYYDFAKANKLAARYRFVSPIIFKLLRLSLFFLVFLCTTCT